MTVSVLQRSPGSARLPRVEAHRPPPGIDDEDDAADERPIGDPDDEDWESDDDDDDEEPLQVRGVAVNPLARPPLARSVPV